MSSQDVVWGPLLVVQKSQLTSLSDPNNSHNTGENRGGDSFPGDPLGEGNVAIESNFWFCGVSYNLSVRLNFMRNTELES